MSTIGLPSFNSTSLPLSRIGRDFQFGQTNNEPIRAQANPAPDTKDSESEGVDLPILDAIGRLFKGLWSGITKISDIAIENLTTGEICAGTAVLMTGYQGLRAESKLAKIPLIILSALAFFQLSNAVIIRQNSADENYYLSTKSNSSMNPSLQASKFGSFWKSLVNFNKGWSLEDLLPVMTMSGFATAGAIWAIGLYRFPAPVIKFFKNIQEASKTNPDAITSFKWIANLDDIGANLKFIIGGLLSMYTGMVSVKLSNLIAKSAYTQSNATSADTDPTHEMENPEKTPELSKYGQHPIVYEYTYKGQKQVQAQYDIYTNEDDAKSAAQQVRDALATIKEVPGEGYYLYSRQVGDTTVDGNPVFGKNIARGFRGFFADNGIPTKARDLGEGFYVLQHVSDGQEPYPTEAAAKEAKEKIYKKLGLRLKKNAKTGEYHLLVGNTKSASTLQRLREVGTFM